MSDFWFRYRFGVKETKAWAVSFQFSFFVDHYSQSVFVRKFKQSPKKSEIQSESTENYSI
jgi:hypothetical protein